MKYLLTIFCAVVILLGFGLVLNHYVQNTEVSSLERIATSSASSIVIKVPVTEILHATNTTPLAPDGPASHWYYSAPLQLQEDTVITGFSVTMEGADTSILHHAAVGIINRPATICTMHFAASGGAYEIYSASRHTLQPVHLPQPYGIFLKAGESILVEFMAHAQATPHGTYSSDKTLEPTLVVKLETDSTRTNPVSFMRLRLDDSPCTDPLRHQAFAVPVSDSETLFVKTSKDNEISSSFIFPATTTIITSGANFWPLKGGKNVAVLLNDKTVMEFTAEQGDAPYKWNIPISYQPLLVPAGTTLHIQSTYNNPFDKPVLDASGMFGFYYTDQITE